jgi:hypothetical protein
MVLYTISVTAVPADVIQLLIPSFIERFGTVEDVFVHEEV